MRIKIRQAHPFPTPVILLAVIGLVIVPLVYTYSLAGAIAIFLLAAMVLSAYQALDIDLKKKIYDQYLWIAGYRQRKSFPFRQIEYFLLTKGSYKKSVNSILAQKVVRGIQYRALIRFSKDEKIILWESKNREKLLKKLKKYAQKTRLPILDLTGKKPKWIE